MFIVKRIFWLFFFLLFFIFSDLKSTYINNNSTVSRILTTTTFFSADNSSAGNPNKIAGFASLEGGVAFDDNNVNCTFDALFPMAGDMNFNGGSLYLNKDLTFVKPLSFSSTGKIYGQYHTINFSSSVKNITFPDQGNIAVLSLADQEALGARIGAVAWSYDDQYLAVFTNATNELQIYYLSDAMLTLTVATSVAGAAITTNDIRWHPSLDYLALCKNDGGGDDLFIYRFDRNIDTLTQTDASEEPGDMNAVVWRPDGNFLAVGGDPSPEVRIFPFDTGTGLLGAAVASITLTGRNVSKSSMSWRSSGDYLAVGTNVSGANPELVALFFDGVSSLTLAASNDVASVCTMVSWNPNNDYIATGFSGSTQRLRIFKFFTTSQTLFDLATAYVGETRTTQAGAWSPATSTGNKLVVGLASGVGSEIKAYSFYSAAETLSLESQIEIGQNINSIAYSTISSTTFVAAGDNTGRLFLYNLLSSFFIDNSTLIFDNDVTLLGPIEFSNDCVINASGNDILVQDNGAFDIKPTSSLSLELVVLNAKKSGVFTPNASDSKVRLHDSLIRMQSHIDFPTGSFFIDGGVDLSQNYTFFLSSDETSTINVYSKFNINNDAIFSLGRTGSESNQPIEFIDSTSELNLNNGTLYVTSTGAQFTKGTIHLNNHAVFDIESTLTEFGLILGDGTSAGDFTLHVDPGTDFRLQNGVMTVNNFENDTLQFNSLGGRIYLQEGSTLYVIRPLSFINGEILYDNINSLSLAPSAYLLLDGTKISQTSEVYSYQLTGTLKFDREVVLDDYDVFLVLNGEGSTNIFVAGQHAEVVGSGINQGRYTLRDFNSKVHWNLDSNVYQDFILNGGSILLDQNMILARDVIFSGSGTVDLSHHIVDLSHLEHTETASIYFDGSMDGFVSLNSAISLSSTWTFSKDVTLDGNGYILTLQDFGALVVEQGSTLKIRNVTIKNLSGQKLRCLDDGAKIILENVIFELNGNYTFEKGAFEFYGDNVFTGRNYTFSLDSAETSTLHANSQLSIEGHAILSTGRKSITSANQPIEGESMSGILNFDHGTLEVNPNGMTLKTMALQVGMYSNIDIKSTNPDYGLRFGTGIASDDAIFTLLSGADLTVKNGALVFNDMVPIKFYFADSAARLVLQSPAKIYVLQNMSLSEGSIRTYSYDSIDIASGKQISSLNTNYQINDVSYDLSGTNTIFATVQLDDGQYLNLKKGKLTPDVWAVSGKPCIYGSGEFAGDIFLQDSTVTLSVLVPATLNSNIILNGGSLNLESNLSFADDKALVGSGTINFNGKKLAYGGKDYTFTSPMIFSQAGDIELNSRTSLTNTWTFIGISNLNGNGNILDLSSGGDIVVNSASTLYLTDIAIKGAGNLIQPFWLLGGDSKIIMSNVFLELDRNLTTTCGSIYVEGPSTFAMKNYSWTFDQAGTLTVDGVTLWRDGLQNSLSGNISFGTPLSNYLTLLNSGTIKQLANEDLLIVDTTNLNIRITNTMNDIWSQYLTTSAYFDSRITITMNDVWEDILTTSLNYDSRVTNLENSVFGTNLNNASGNIILNQDKGVDFTVHASLALSLTLSNESILYLAGQDTELKLSDTIYVIGRNNIINVQKRFTINGLISFEEGSELIFNFDDKYENPIVYFGKNLTLSELSRLTFVNKGTALFKDGTTIQFNSSVDANRPALVVSNDATLMIDEKLSGHSESSLTLRGLGIISILNGEIFIDSLKHLIVGGGDTTTDRFDIYGDSGGALSLLGIGSKVSLHKAYINMDFRQSGILYIGQNGIFEINSLDQVASAGTLNNFKFTLNGELWIYDDGKFILGDNSSDSVINLNTTGASIGGYGVLQYLTSSSYSGRLYENNRKDVSVTAKNLIATLLQRSTNLLVSTLFLDKDGNYKVRLGNGVVASLLSGDNVLFDNPSNYFVYGTNGGRSFSIDASGNRS